ncbi:lipase 3-like [Musca domestica]|uniref:Lipase 3-like n=1 Tax=Musca domestica TaxID=7370 RepID=A0A9J7DKQ3_MUSDO|nr:lipase 3-like [Musca domestica]
MKAQSIVISLALLLETVNGNLSLNTCDRILQHGYPCENYTVTTQDGYLPTLFRTPGNPRGREKQNEVKSPPVLLMHCLLCSSDVFVLNGPNDGLPFMLAAGGYDVWFGNARGNTYSQRHIYLSPTSEKFWAFSLDEIALIDLPTTIEYILAATNEQKLHYIGYSQGSTIFMMLQCAKPEYGQKIMTSHLMAPTVFMRHVRSPIFLYLVPLLGPPSDAANFLGTFPMQNVMGMIRILGWRLCNSPPMDVICLRLMQLIGG